MAARHTRVLVVDDDPDILDAIRFLLEDEGYAVTTTEKGDYAENLHDGTSGLPELIILDVLLSGKDGRTICRALKSRPDTQHIPVVMISAHPDAEEAAYAVGADYFVSKPFDMFSLLEVVERFSPRS